MATQCEAVLPMNVAIRKWTKNHNSVSIDYGPLTFSLAIGERWSRYGSNEKWPDQEVFATTPWNYGLLLDEKDPGKTITIASTGKATSRSAVHPRGRRTFD